MRDRPTSTCRPPSAVARSSNAAVELADPHHPAREAVHEHKLRTREWVTELVGDCGVDDPRFVARQIVQLMEGAITTALVEGGATAAALPAYGGYGLLRARATSSGLSQPETNQWVSPVAGSYEHRLIVPMLPP
jgi:hypothetical protein